jgi:hypothetical protein
MMISIIFHEIGHILYFLALNKKVKLHFRFKNIFNFGWEVGSTEDYINLSDKQYNSVLLCGIAAGLIPIIAASMIWIYFWLLIIPYAVGAKSDIKQLYININ